MAASCPEARSFVHALEQFGRYLLTDPSMASLDAYADLGCVELSSLCYDRRFEAVYGDEVRGRAESTGIVVEGNAWKAAEVVATFFGAVARFACDQAERRRLGDVDTSQVSKKEKSENPPEAGRGPLPR